MRKVLPLLLLPLLLLPLGGCVITVDADDFESGYADWQDRQERNDRAIRRLALGRSLSSVEADLGDPDFSESFRREGNEFVVLFYRTQRNKNDGRTTKDETTPLVFVDGELIGWGNSAIEYATAR